MWGKGGPDSKSKISETCVVPDLGAFSDVGLEIILSFFLKRPIFGPDNNHCFLISGWDQKFAAPWPYNWFTGLILYSLGTFFDRDVGCIKSSGNVISRPARLDRRVFQ